MANTHNAVTVRDYLKLFVEQGGVYMVDDMSYVHEIKTNEKLPLPRADGTIGYITVYDPAQVNTDVIPFNPFTEGLEVSKDKQWFYHTRTTCISGALYRIMEAIINGVIQAKDKKKTEESTDDPTYVAMVKAIAPFAQDDIDSKTIGELEEITKSLTNFFNIYYSHREKQCVLNVGIFESNFVGSFGAKIRKKTWPVFKKIMGALLRSETPREDYKTKATVAGCPNFSAYAHIYVKVLEAIEPYLFMQQRTFDIPALKLHLSKLGEYYNTAKYYVGPTVPMEPVAPKSQAAPWGNQFNTTPGFNAMGGAMNLFGGLGAAAPLTPAIGTPIISVPTDTGNVTASPLLEGPNTQQVAVAQSPAQPAPINNAANMNAMMPTMAPQTMSAMSPLVAAMPQMVQNMPMMPTAPAGFPSMMNMQGIVAPLQNQCMFPQMTPVMPGMPTGYSPAQMGGPVVQMQTTMVTAPYGGGGVMYQQAPPTTMVQLGTTGVSIESPLAADGNRVNSPLI